MAESSSVPLVGRADVEKNMFEVCVKAGFVHSDKRHDQREMRGLESRGQCRVGGRMAG